MAAQLVIIACLIVEPHTCSEIPVPELTSSDVVSCNATARANSEKWQNDHKDQYLVIATKCARAPDDAAKPDGAGKAGGGDSKPDAPQ